MVDRIKTRENKEMPPVTREQLGAFKRDLEDTKSRRGAKLATLRSQIDRMLGCATGITVAYLTITCVWLRTPRQSFNATCVQDVF